MKTYENIQLRAFDVRIRDERTGEASEDVIVLTKQQLQAAQIVGQSSKELIYRYYGRAGYRAMLLHEFIPYLKLHCALSEMEQAATAALQSGESVTQPETAYHTAVQAYVAECRGKINSGDYELPPAPRLADFDPELQAYKEHVREEIAQEAAAAGMTVEEYAANGYEPYPAAEGQPQEQETPVFDKLPPEQQQELSGEVKATLQMLIDADLQATGELTSETLEAIATQGYSYRDGNLVRQDTPTELQLKAAEIAKKYESLPMPERIGIIAQAFGCTSGKIETSPCSGKWRGTSDISIRFDNGASLGIGNDLTPKAKTAKVQNELVNATLRRYNPEIVAATKEAALAALRAREVKDNEIAAQKGLKPYMIAYRTAKQNVDKILGLVPEDQEQNREQKPER